MNFDANIHKENKTIKHYKNESKCKKKIASEFTSFDISGK